jgi:uncharacterized protein (TIGR03067 family)
MFRVILFALAAVSPTLNLRADEPGRLEGVDARRASVEDLASLQGVWVRVSAEVEGRTTDLREGSWTATYRGDQLTLESDGRHYRTGVVTLDASRSPRAMNTWDLDGPQKDATMPGIYAIDGDTLKVCFAHPGAKRPTEFKTGEAGGFLCYTYQRRKP